MDINLVNRFYKYAINFGSYILLSKIIIFIQLFYLWKNLSLENLGKIALIQVIIIILSPFLSFAGSEIVQRFFYEWKNKNIEKENITIIFLITIIFNSLICIILYFFSSDLFFFLLKNIEFNPLIKLSIIYVFLDTFKIVPHGLLRITNNYKLYGLLNAIRSILSLMFCFFFISFQNLELIGFLYANILADFIMCIFYLLYIKNNFLNFFGIQSINKKNLIGFYKYGLPLIPAALSENFSNIVDKILLEKYVPLSQIGTYNISNLAGSSIGVLNNALRLSAIPMLFENIANKGKTNTGSMLSEVTKIYIFTTATFSLLISIFIKYLLLPLNLKSVEIVVNFIPYFVIYYFFQTMVATYGRGIDLSKKTIYAPFIMLLNFIINFILMFFLVTSHGVLGAIFGLILSTLIKLLIQGYFAIKFFPRKLNLLFLFILIASYILIFLISDYVFSIFSISISTFIIDSIIFSLGTYIFFYFFLKKDIINKKKI
ncbi:RfbX Membrane protein involved in the export of O-antigen and teichoic acid [Candidatus Pelagibacterales bacterium]